MQSDFKIDYASHEAAKYAVEHWHYSKCLPAGKIYKLGVWENDIFIGVILFSRGANNNIGSPYGLDQTQVCELTRIALNKHIVPLSQILAIAIKKYKKDNKGTKLIVSFADERQKHLGVIYQATNWVYTGKLKSTPEYFVNGRWMHQRTVNALFGTIKGIPDANKRDGGYRYRYLYPLNSDIRSVIEKLSKPYPKCAVSVESDISEIHSEEGGAVPTTALLSESV